MNHSVNTIIYPVKDIAQSKALFSQLLGIEPYVESPYYVGFKVGNQDIGLDPNGHQHGMTPYFSVDNIQNTLQSLLDAGAELLQGIQDVGGGKQIACVKDANGNIIGLSQES